MGTMTPGIIGYTLAAAAVCRAAQHCGLLSALETAPGGPAIPEVPGVDDQLIVTLFETLDAMGVVGRDGKGIWRADPAAGRAIERAGRLGDALESALSSGRSASRSDETASTAAGHLCLVADLEASWGDAPELLASRLSGVGRRILDLGAGTAAWSRALLAADPLRRAVAVDLQPVLAVTAGAVAEAGVADRVERVAFGRRTGLLPSGCDLVVVANVCHLFRPDVLGELFVRIEKAAAPGATLVVVDVLGDDPPRPEVALYALGLALCTQAGKLHAFATYARLLHLAGFGRIERADLDGPLSAVIARKPSAEGVVVGAGQAGGDEDVRRTPAEVRR